MPKLNAPFVYFGCKRKIASKVWDWFGNDISNYVEPMCGSAAVLLARPKPRGFETINDNGGMIVNAYRSIKYAPEETAEYADAPVFEADIHANHIWLLNLKSELTYKLCAEPEYFDAKAAGRWLHGMACYIGSGYCSGNGAWQNIDGVMTKVEKGGVKRQIMTLGHNLGVNAVEGIGKRLPAMSGEHAEMGVRRTFEQSKYGISMQLPALGRDRGTNCASGISMQMPALGSSEGRAEIGVRRKSLNTDEGVCRKIQQISGKHAELGVRRNVVLLEWFQRLQDRLRNVRIACGDWQRVCTPFATYNIGTTAVFLDPPYAPGEWSMDSYEGDAKLTADVQAWCLENGSRKDMRICVCSYEGTFNLPGWRTYTWKAKGGYANQGSGETRGKKNCKRETVWISPHCVESSLLSEFE